MLKFAAEIEKLERDDAARIDQEMLLYWLVRGSKAKTCVEVGTHKGVTALYLAHALYDNGEGGVLYTADPFDYKQQETFNKFPELASYIRYQQIRGAELEVKDIDFVFIDGYHDYDVVLEEILHFLPRLSPEGIMVFHDAGEDNQVVGVNKAIRDAGIEAVWLPMSGKMRLYSNFKDYPIFYENQRTDA